MLGCKEGILGDLSDLEVIPETALNIAVAGLYSNVFDCSTLTNSGASDVYSLPTKYLLFKYSNILYKMLVFLYKQALPPLCIYLFLLCLLVFS